MSGCGSCLIQALLTDMTALRAGFGNRMMFNGHERRLEQVLVTA